MARPCGVRLFGFRLFGPLCRVAGLSSAAAGGSGRALFERSEFSPTPPDASSARYPAGALTSARLSLLTFFGEAKKVSALSGASPDTQPSRRSELNQKAHALCEPRCAHPVVCFSMKLKSSYMAMAMAPTTSKPLKARPICMAEPAEISR